MKLHLISGAFNKYDYAMTWCGRMVPRRQIVRPQDMGKEVECKVCRKAYSSSAALYDVDTSVSATR